MPTMYLDLCVCSHWIVFTSPQSQELGATCPDFNAEETDSMACLRQLGFSQVIPESPTCGFANILSISYSNRGVEDKGW